MRGTSVPWGWAGGPTDDHRAPWTWVSPKSADQEHPVEGRRAPELPQVSEEGRGRRDWKWG